MITITGILLGLIILAIGRPWQSMALIIFVAVVADLIWMLSGHDKTPFAVVTTGVMSIYIMGFALPMFFGFRDNYMDGLRSGYGDAYVDTLCALTPDWLFWV